MSGTDATPARMTLRSALALPQAAGYLAAATTSALASAVARRDARRARRELAALDDRTLADLGLERAELTSLFDALAERRTAAVLAHSFGTAPAWGA